MSKKPSLPGERQFQRLFERAKAAASNPKSDKEFHVFDHNIVINSGNLTVKRRVIDTSSKKDYGSDPLGDGTFRMVPSGDIVDFQERNRRLNK